MRAPLVLSHVTGLMEAGGQATLGRVELSLFLIDRTDVPNLWTGPKCPDCIGLISSISRLKIGEIRSIGRHTFAEN